ncbi:hypothetical protein Clacol_009255 [Clathrus columnatus]|uniref:Protein farnesyltransferase/geranylgeranyltransferase type-1 subunit alpha n=1 Tax=Clathrus columnatus TaxID=1419009 RepID=A0AAV5AKP0_9AGAM|nr:hypothetical protein Clacol_009255 [Clathrus columnatus]
MSEQVLYAQNSAWSDVIPIPQFDEGAKPVAPILYSEEYRDATDYFRGVVRAGEKSQRVLDLTEHLIRLNPGHYSVWQYRYDTLLAIKADLREELRRMDELATTHMKTYQVWHHRQLLIEQLHEPDSELDFIKTILDIDSKNYHTWGYRQWILAHFNREDLWIAEIRYVEQMLKKDLRNNSAWNHRFFVLWSNGRRESGEIQDEFLRTEIQFVKDNISLAPNNDAAWNYYRGVLQHTNQPFSTQLNFVKLYAEERDSDSDTDSEVVLDLDNPSPGPRAVLPCAIAMEFLAEIYEEKRTPEDIDKAISLYHKLTILDKIRKSYWEWRTAEAKRLLTE